MLIITEENEIIMIYSCSSFEFSMTTNIKKILVPLDGSENSLRGLDAAIYHAQKSQAEITAINILPNMPEMFRDAPPYSEKAQKDAENMMTEAKKRTSENDVKFQDKIVRGSTGKELVKFAEENNFDLITIGSRGISSVKEAFLGSVSNYVSHKSNVPVLIIK